jgi:fatty acid desaturase
VAVALGVYGGWFAVTLLWRVLPWPVALATLVGVSAWHTSLQHEVIHGHPFRQRVLNDALGWLPLSLWVPYGDYADSHLAHHRDQRLTDPFDDPESFYVSRERWQRATPVGRALLRANRTLAGRMLLGPLLAAASFWRGELPALRHDGRRRRHLAHHVVGVAVVLGWAARCGVSLWLYVLGAFYLARALGMVRSFCEHRWVPEPATRSAMVRAGRFWSLLFLNNNLHHTHHARPGAPWYRLPILADALGSHEAAAAGAGCYDSYLDVARRYLVHPFCQVVHPPAVEVKV